MIGKFQFIPEQQENLGSWKTVLSTEKARKWLEDEGKNGTSNFSYYKVNFEIGDQPWKDESSWLLCNSLPKIQKFTLSCIC